MDRVVREGGQQFILDEANNLKCTPNSAYIFAYKRMTKARDKARCGNDEYDTK